MLCSHFLTRKTALATWCRSLNYGLLFTFQDLTLLTFAGRGTSYHFEPDVSHYGAKPDPTTLGLMYHTVEAKQPSHIITVGFLGFQISSTQASLLKTVKSSQHQVETLSVSVCVCVQLCACVFKWLSQGTDMQTPFDNLIWHLVNVHNQIKLWCTVLSFSTHPGAFMSHHWAYRW